VAWAWHPAVGASLPRTLGVTLDHFTFITKLVEALAWPLASIILIALLRKEIRLLLPTLRKLKAGPVEAEFERGTALLKAELPQQPKASEALATSTSTLPSESPRAAVLEAWLSLEAAAHEALALRTTKNHGPSAMTSRPTLRNLAQSLEGSGLLHQGQINLFKELLHLRNEVVHTLEFAPTQEAILRYVETANYLKWWLAEGAQ
jgi:hypothetical protein